MSEKAKIVTISEFYIEEFNSRCNHLFEAGYSMIHYSVAGLPKVHKYVSDILSGFQGKIENLDPVFMRFLLVSIRKNMSDKL